MKEAYSKPKLVIVGDLKGALRYVRNKRFALVSMLGAVASLSDYVSVIQVANNSEYALLVKAWSKDHKEEAFTPPKPKHESWRDVRRNMLCCIPSIGGKRADLLLEKYPTIVNISDGLEVDDYASIIGEKSTKALIDAFYKGKDNE